MEKKKIFNDPLYGLIGFDHEIIYKLIDHKDFQRLRRIKQMGLTDYIYPGAVHTRFQHSLGAVHLMKKSIETLRWKGVKISDEEYKAASIAILLHDIGHGPFSHALERIFLNLDHEDITISIMHELNEEFDGELSLAIKIFKGEYKRKFLYQLISGHIDVDRLDYLTRDSFFTGVAEGVVGYDRIIKMLNVANDNLVIEEKAIYSIEKFLLARKIMYWQVYLHKTSLAVEKMIFTLFDYMYTEANDIDFELLPVSLRKFRKDISKKEKVQQFKNIDDSDVIFAIKNLMKSKDPVISFLANGLIKRKLLKIFLKNVEFNGDSLKLIRHKVEKKCGFNQSILKKMIFTGSVSNNIYSTKDEEIEILLKSGEVLPLSEFVPLSIFNIKSVKYFVLYPDCF